MSKAKAKAPAEEKVIQIKCTSDTHLSFSEMMPFEDNPREISPAGLNKLKKSILELGIFKPFLVWQHEGKNKIIGGNQRYAVIHYLVEHEGYTVSKLPVTVLNVPEGVARTIVLRDNQSDGEWAYEQLSEYLAKLEEFGVDKDLTGFSDREITDLEKLGQSAEELRADLEKSAAEEDVGEMMMKKFGISFKVPEGDWAFFQNVMKQVQAETKTDDVWVNLKHTMAKLYPMAEFGILEQVDPLEAMKEQGLETDPDLTVDDEPQFEEDAPPLEM